MMRKLLPVLLLLIPFLPNAQQNPAVIDSFKLKLSKAKTSDEKVELLGKLSMTLMNTNIAEADKYGTMMSEEAELSRKRELMAKAHYYNGLRYSFFVQNKEFLQKSIDYFNQGLAIARQNKLDKEIASGYLYLSNVYLRVPDLDKSLGYTTQAFAIVEGMDNDSLKAETSISYGNIYQVKKERILALRYYLNALRIAEETKNYDLLRSCYTNLSAFYADIKEYDKAIDYAQKSFDELPLTNAENIKYQRIVDLYGLGNLYIAKKNFEMSSYYFERSIKLADSINYQPLKMPGYNGLLNQYIQAKQPQKALEFFNSRTDLKKFIINFGYGHAVDNAYGVIYTELGKFDSAQIYFSKAEPSYEAKGTPSNKIGFYMQYARFFDKSGNTTKAIAYYTKAKSLADQISNLEWQQDISKELDSAYAKTGDYKQSRYFNSLFLTYKDSLQKLGEEKDLMSMELKDEEQRQVRLDKEKAEALKRKHDLQYTAITIGIGVVFLFLVLMGAFKVSETTIKIVGFFAFILLFEFIILLADNKIHDWTHGEPLPVLGIKIILIAMLLPLHHWLEHKAVSYLASKKLIIPDRKSIWNSLTKRKTANH